MRFGVLIVAVAGSVEIFGATGPAAIGVLLIVAAILTNKTVERKQNGQWPFNPSRED